jgi:two-component system, sensor histidine kinase and response regulator
MINKETYGFEDKPLILIVDDILNNLQIIGNTLIDEGYEISMATNGSQALAMVDTVLPDLILLDVMMPDMDGFEVCRTLKENDLAKDIPVIFLTAKNETEDIVKGFEAGGIDYIVKPFNSSELLARVNTYVELKRSKELFNQINIKLRRLNEEKMKNSEELKTPVINLMRILKDIHDSVPDNNDLKERISQAINFSEKIYSLVEKSLE